MLPHPAATLNRSGQIARVVSRHQTRIPSMHSFLPDFPLALSFSPSLCLTTTALPHSQNIPIMPYRCRSHYFSLSHRVIPPRCQIEFTIDFRFCNCSVPPPVETDLTAILFTLRLELITDFVFSLHAFDREALAQKMYSMHYKIRVSQTFILTV